MSERASHRKLPKVFKKPNATATPLRSIALLSGDVMIFSVTWVTLIREGISLHRFHGLESGPRRLEK